MKLRLFRRFDSLVISTIVAGLAMSQMVYAQAPVVTRDELKQALTSASTTREKNLEQVKGFLSSDEARKAMTLANLDSNRVQTAVSALNAKELAKLAEETKQLQSDFAGGALTNQQITYILIALCTAVIVLILK